MPPRRLDTRLLHRIPPSGFETYENSRRPQPPSTSADPMISTMVATLGITVEVISPNGDMTHRNPEFENIVRAAVDIADSDDPRLSSGELLIDGNLDEEKRLTAALRHRDGSIRFLTVKILLDYKYRIKDINEILESVDLETLDSEKCSICIESYSTAATLSEPDIAVTTSEEPSTFDIGAKDPDLLVTTSNELHHSAAKMKKCGHIFGSRCIIQWLKENSTCPMCRGRVSLPIPCHLKIWVV